MAIRYDNADVTIAYDRTYVLRVNILEEKNYLYAHVREC